GADLIVDTKARAHNTLAALELFDVLGTDATLARKLAFAVGDDHLQPALGGFHRLLERIDHNANAVGAHLAQPVHAHGAQGFLDVHAGRRSAAAGGARRNVLLAGGGGVAVLHDDQNAIAFVEKIRGNAGD